MVLHFSGSTFFNKIKERKEKKNFKMDERDFCSIPDSKRKSYRVLKIVLLLSILKQNQR